MTLIKQAHQGCHRRFRPRLRRHLRRDFVLWKLHPERRIQQRRAPHCFRIAAEPLREQFQEQRVVRIGRRAERIAEDRLPGVIAVRAFQRIAAAAQHPQAEFCRRASEIRHERGFPDPGISVDDQRARLAPLAQSFQTARMDSVQPPFPTICTPSEMSAAFSARGR